MKYKLEPIEDLIKEVEKLASNPTKNKDELEAVRSKIVKQVKAVSKYDIDDLKRKMANSDLSDDEYYKYLDLYKELKKYSENSEKLEAVLDRKYSKLAKRKPINKKLIGFIVAGALIVSAATIGIVKAASKKTNDNKPETNNTVSQELRTEATTEAVTEIPSTEIITEATTEKVTEVPSTEAATATQITEVPSTEAATEKVTEAPSTEVVTERVTETPSTEKVTEQSTERKAVDEARQLTIADLFSTMKDDVIKLYSSDEAKMMKAKGKEYVVNTIDFIFFGSSIDGITFNDLTDTLKSDIYYDLQAMDEIIMQYAPDYKESLGEKYNAVKKFSAEKLDRAKELIINKIGQEKYDSIIEKKDEIYEKITDTIKKYGGRALKFLRNKYLEWKEE